MFVLGQQIGSHRRRRIAERISQPKRRVTAPKVVADARLELGGGDRRTVIGRGGTSVGAIATGATFASILQHGDPGALTCLATFLPLRHLPDCTLALLALDCST
jgi:hypothetical protein